MSILLLDNYDSFTFNLVHLVEKLTEEEVVVKRNDELSLGEVEKFSSIILSPGPGLPQDAGIMMEVLKEYAQKKKILGVCLGMQAIAIHFGSTLKNLKTVCHGVSTLIIQTQADELFNGCPTGFSVGRYHSWVVDESNLSPELLVLAEDENQDIMAIKHQMLPIYGVQFHPESILSEYGEIILKNWLSL